MKIIFAGTPDLAVPTLDALVQSQHSVIAVYTQPDRPAGRGRVLAPSPVKEYALTQNLPIYQPQTLRNEEAQKIFAAHHADVMIVLAYGLILPQAILDAPKYGCINVHVSLLPRWRGASPIQQAIWAGDTETGVSIMQMDAGLDTGPVYTQTSCPIEANDTGQSLQDRLATLSPAALLPVLESLEKGKIQPLPQDSTLTCYAPKISKHDAKLDWNKSAVYLERQIRALNPWPVAYYETEHEIVRVWQSEAFNHKTIARPGTILDVQRDPIPKEIGFLARRNGASRGSVSKYLTDDEREFQQSQKFKREGYIDVATGEGVLRIQRVQCAGSRAMTVREVLNGKPKLFQKGQVLV